MIQRVQTLFLLAIIALSSILFLKPFEIVKSNTDTYLVSLLPGSLNGVVKPTIYAPIALNFLVIIFSLVTIFKFKRRKKQIKYTHLILALSALLIGNIFLLHFLKVEEPNANLHYTKYCIIPVLNIALALLARWYIIKDDKLVRSADRIR